MAMPLTDALRAAPAAAFRSQQAGRGPFAILPGVGCWSIRGFRSGAPKSVATSIYRFIDASWQCHADASQPAPFPPPGGWLGAAVCPASGCIAWPAPVAPLWGGGRGVRERPVRL